MKNIVHKFNCLENNHSQIKLHLKDKVNQILKEREKIISMIKSSI